jgi:exopolysaccharide biosynthesis polyprenyl glycosylphosphotransferase
MQFVYRTKQFILFIGDTGSFFIGLWLALSARSLSLANLADIQKVSEVFFFVFIFWIIINSISGLYDLDKMQSHFFINKRIAESAIISFVVGILFFYLLPKQNISPKTILALTVIFGYGLIAFWRFIYHAYLSKNTLKTNILFVGYTQEVKELIQITQQNPGKGYVPVAIIDPDNILVSKDIPEIEVYRTLKTIRPAITNHNVNLVVISPHLRQDPNALRELYELLFWHVHITNLPTIYEVITGRIPPSTFSEGWFLDHLKNKERPVYDKIRTLTDYIIAIGLLPVLIALFPLVATAIKLTSRGPIYIKQTRIGKNGKQFTLYKFRSMYALSKDGSAEVDGARFASKDDNRITLVGKLLRKTRIDELPQIINLLRFDLALIGPRPERPEIVKQLEEAMPYYSLRHTIKPGITGWAAVHQHYTDTMETSLQKLQFDLYYIKNRSLVLDLSIVLRTVQVVIRMMGQ